MRDSRSGTAPQTMHSTAVVPLAPAAPTEYAGGRTVDVRERTA
ncbi:hypothetical protein ACWIG5_26905 [Streptomyces lydicus]